MLGGLRLCLLFCSAHKHAHTHTYLTQTKQTRVHWEIREEIAHMFGGEHDYLHHRFREHIKKHGHVFEGMIFLLISLTCSSRVTRSLPAFPPWVLILSYQRVLAGRAYDAHTHARALVFPSSPSNLDPLARACLRLGLPLET